MADHVGPAYNTFTFRSCQMPDDEHKVRRSKDHLASTAACFHSSVRNGLAASVCLQAVGAYQFNHRFSHVAQECPKQMEG